MKTESHEEEGIFLDGKSFGDWGIRQRDRDEERAW